MRDVSASAGSVADRVPPALVALVVLAGIVQVASFGWTFAGHDFIRDLLAAGDIADGLAFPLRGPSINDMVHVGPLWFYVLALPLALGGGLVAATIWAGALATLKAWAAWRLGRELDGPRFGLLLAAVSLLPGWSLVHQFQLTQAIVLELAVYAALLPMLRLWRGGDRRNWVFVGLWLGLAVQAHPVGLFLLFPMAIIAAHRRDCWRNDFPWWFLGAGLSILPLAPMVWAEWREGFPALALMQAFADGENAAFRPMGGWPVLYGATVQGARVMIGFAEQFGLDAVSTTLFMALLVAMAGGLVATCRSPRARARLAASLLLALFCAVWLASVRSSTPYYLAQLLSPFLAIAAATLAHGGGGSRIDRARGGLTIAAAVGLSMLAAAVVVGQGQTGRLTFPLGGLGDVAAGNARTLPVATMPVWAVDKLARQTCDEDTVVLRGELAALFDFHQGIPWIWECATPPRIVFVAAPKHERSTEKVLMSPDALRRLGWPNADWRQVIDMAPSRVLSQGTVVSVPEPPRRYPHRGLDPQPTREATYVFITLPGEALAVYAPLFVFDGGAVLGARVDGNEVAPRVSTNSGAVFVPPPSRGGGAIRWEIRLHGRRHDQIEVFTLQLPGAPDVGTPTG